MKLTVGYQQALSMIGMIAVQKNEEPLKMTVIAKRMKMPVSYARKIAAKLVHAEILKSSANRYGGYKLNKSPSEISLEDVFNAIEGTDPFIQNNSVADDTFTRQDFYPKKVEEVVMQLMLAEIDYRNRLSEYSIEQTLPFDKEGKIETIDWNNID